MLRQASAAGKSGASLALLPPHTGTSSLLHRLWQPHMPEHTAGVKLSPWGKRTCAAKRRQSTRWGHLAEDKAWCPRSLVSDRACCDASGGAWSVRVTQEVLAPPPLLSYPLWCQGTVPNTAPSPLLHSMSWWCPGTGTFGDQVCRCAACLS